MVESMYESDVYTIEPGNESMIYDYTALFNAVDSLDNPNHIQLSKDSFPTSFSSPYVDFKKDTILVRDPNSNLIATGIIIPQNTLSSELMIQVHPEHRRQGIGTRILHHLTEIGLERGCSKFICRIPSFRPYAIPFIKDNGFTYEHSWTKLRIEHKKPVSTPSLPWGLTVRGLDTERELDVWEYLQNTVFKNNPHYEPVDVDRLKSLVGHSSFDRNLVVLGIVSEKPVGYGLGWSISSDTGEKTLRIDNIGVLSDYRRHRYGQALVFELINRAYIKGHTSSEVTILSSKQPAMRLFEKCGFRAKYKLLGYTRTLET